MKMLKSILIIFIIIVIQSKNSYASGVIYRADVNGEYQTLISSEIEIEVRNQVAVTVSTQVFKNNTSENIDIKYGFPMPEEASAVKLRYKIDSVWYLARFSHKPQDSITQPTPGGEKDYNLITYLGKNPVIYPIEKSLDSGAVITVQLEYVEMLPYKWGTVKYNYLSDYSLIQDIAVLSFSLDFSLFSDREIQSVSLYGYDNPTKKVTENVASFNLELENIKLEANLEINYSLSNQDLDLYSLSTFLPDSAVPDNLGQGFFAFVVEPVPDESTETISKVFTLIIDRSGSMSGDKIVQAKNAARFIVENLNLGDKFNVISFSSDITSFSPVHVEFNAESETNALDYINRIQASGATNISGAFSKAFPQFDGTESDKANIIIFFTDGEATEGIVDTDDLIEHVNGLNTTLERDVTVFSFGIGSNVNERLLTSVALENKGMVSFLKNEELEDVITDFYLMIKNPVVINTKINFSPDATVELYPSVLPNLYKGQQLVLVGRYNTPGNYDIELSGNAYSSPVNYDYNTGFSDTLVQNYSFLPKIWAKAKIKELVNEYYLNSNRTERADSIKNAVIDISLEYGVISPFTSFSGSEVDDQQDNNTGGSSSPIFYPVEIEEIMPDITNENTVLSSCNIYPNPSYGNVNISFDVNKNVTDYAVLTFYDLSGKVLYSTLISVSGINTYQLYIDFNNIPALQNIKGMIPISIQFKNDIIHGKITRM